MEYTQGDVRMLYADLTFSQNETAGPGRPVGPADASALPDAERLLV